MDVLDPLICFDNHSIINITFNSMLYSHTKYIEINQYFVHQKVEEKENEPLYVRSCDQVADIFTKGVTQHQF